MYQMSILPGKKLMFNGVNILNSMLLDMKKMKKTKVAKSLLNIYVINFHNLDCIKYLLHNYSNYIADQIQDQNSEADNFANRKKIDKFITPLLRNAFLGKSDFKLNYGKLALRLYKKLKELLNIISGYSAPKLDGKGFFKSLRTKIFAQEDSVLNTRGKRKGNLQKLEYYLKVILTAFFIALPSSTKANLQDVEVPRTIKEFLNLVIAVKVILS
ncbi:hypothetical protein RhiirC2_796860 [Rhizophagus irregularis]|uniref:Uncharacterized protein n=1 Tax=Rhizophagus irregularis TaxID=588596 RepID=A0A2N1M8Y3_9GLOM|nr:hypothetical protein RhiirC2_796860 [Rhizophagus irregularis]